MINPARLLGAVEIGTANVTVMIGELAGKPHPTLNLIGVTQAAAEGVRKGEIVDFRAVSNVTHDAISAAEQSAGVQLENVFLAISGRHLEGFAKLGSANVSGSDNTVRRADIERALLDGKRKELPPGRIYIHHIRNHFRLDGRLEPDPLGREGSRLEVGYWSVHAEERKVRDLIHVVNGYGLNVEDIIVSSVASAAVVTPREAKQAGALVLDIGAGVTDWVVFRDGVVVRTGVVAVGADHLRNDLALGLRVNRKHADKLLREFGTAVPVQGDKEERVWMVGDQMIGDRRIPKASLIRIIQLRIDELFSIVRKQLGPLAAQENLSAGVFLTGGVSRLPRVAELAAERFGVPAAVAVNPGWVRSDVRGPEFSTALGLLHYASRKEESADVGPQKLLKRVTRLFAG
ncbi:MAG: cell division protein FtsA [Opitutales bacterium]